MSEINEKVESKRWLHTSEDNLKRNAHFVVAGTSASVAALCSPSVSSYAGIAVIAACCASAHSTYCAMASVRKLDLEGRNELREKLAYWNYLADYGDSLGAQLLSALPLGVLIFCWWIGFAALSLLHGTFYFGMRNIYLGAGMLSLLSTSGAISDLRPNQSSFKIIRSVRITVENMVVLWAAGSGALVYLTVAKQTFAS